MIDLNREVNNLDYARALVEALVFDAHAAETTGEGMPAEHRERIATAAAYILENVAESDGEADQRDIETVSDAA